MSLDDSPATVVSSTFSTTPRNIYSQTGSSLTPTRMPAQPVVGHFPPIHHNVDDYYEAEEQDEHTWGDDAVLRWEGVDSVNSEDDISSVAPEEAGVSDDDEENWGRDAIIDFTYASQESGTEAEEEVEMRGEEQFEEVEAVELGGALDNAWSSVPVETDESPAQLMARGMPDYQAWDDTKLQRLTEKYGYRPITKHSALVKIATECWKAINPLPTVLAASTATARSGPAAKSVRKKAPKIAEAEDSDGSITSSDIPLAQSSKKKGKGKAKVKATAEQPVEEEEAIETPLPERFEQMIRKDADLYLRILRYEPISFDELISKAIANRISGKGWKDHLKRFLDLQGITFYTADPTGQRRRR